MMNLPFHRLSVVAVGALAAILGNCSKESPSGPTVVADGQEKKPDTRVLEQGAAALQARAPIEQLNIYLDAFHPMKEHPEMQMEAHHFCREVNEEFVQCVIYDGNTRTANLVGVEYIISERLFTSLDGEEKKLWHPHNHEILSGQLIAPGLPDTAEKAFLRKMVNSYGKTWHLWSTGHKDHPQGDPLPVGPPHLAWSFNHDGEALPGLVEERDQRMKVSSADKKKQRADLAPLAHPQEGVDALKGAFPGAGERPAEGRAK
jgi:hypothetical protein